VLVESRRWPCDLVSTSMSGGETGADVPMPCQRKCWATARYACLDAVQPSNRKCRCRKIGQAARRHCGSRCKARVMCLQRRGKKCKVNQPKQSGGPMRCLGVESPERRSCRRSPHQPVRHWTPRGSSEGRQPGRIISGAISACLFRVPVCT
jgi:hypothetical protein